MIFNGARTAGIFDDTCLLPVRPKPAWFIYPLPRPLSTWTPGLSHTSEATQTELCVQESSSSSPAPPMASWQSCHHFGSPEQQQASESKFAAPVHPKLSYRKWYFTSSPQASPPELILKALLILSLLRWHGWWLLAQRKQDKSKY